jgi:glycosyltransferase involved in cell wall biosynthesis/GT2 family glycosyltransferase
MVMAPAGLAEEESRTAMRPKRLLVSAYACGPGRGSEPGIGWNTARELARRHDVWLITSRENEAAIRTELAARPLAGLHVVFLDWPGWLAWTKRTRVGYEVQHYLWQAAAYLHGRRLHRTVGFDLVHHVTMGRYWSPSFLALLPVPFVWGPVGGGESAPKRFWRDLGVQGVLLELARQGAQWIGERDPFLALTARRCVLALATSEESKRRITRLGTRSVHVVSQVGLPDSELEVLARCRAPEDAPLRFVSIGRLLHWKGFHLGLKAFARLGRMDTEYWIVGTGPALRSLTVLAHKLGIADRVRFCGMLSRDDTLACLERTHVLVHPSLHESGGMVCIEAMAAGKPVICLDLGGPALQVTPETGFKIAAREPDEAVAGLAHAMTRLVLSRELRERMGAVGRARAAGEFNWQRKGEHLEGLYAAALEKTPLGPAGTSLSAASDSVRAESRHCDVTVSAVMPTHNMAPYVPTAIDSILAQSFQDWELVVIDDGSTDETPSVLARYRDPRIRIHRLPVNSGRATARNAAVKLARGRYIAICDSDDISVPERFAKQAAYLDAHPDVDVVSSDAKFFWGQEPPKTRLVFPDTSAAIHRRFERGHMAIAHGACMVRASCFEQHGLYCEELRCAEDFEFFHRMHREGRFFKLADVLLLYRHEPGWVPLQKWMATSRWHRYALYLSEHRRQRPDACLSFEQFAGRLDVRAALCSVDMLRFLKYHARAYLQRAARGASEQLCPADSREGT